MHIFDIPSLLGFFVAYLTLNFPITNYFIFQGYKYFGFDPETLCHIKSISEMDTSGTGNGPIGNGPLDQLLSPAAGLRTPLPASALMGQPITLVKSEDGFGVVRSSPPLPPSVAALAAASPASSVK